MYPRHEQEDQTDREDTRLDNNAPPDDPARLKEEEMKRIDAKTMVMMLAGTFMVSAMTLGRPVAAGTQQTMAGASAVDAQGASKPVALQGLMRLLGTWDAQANLVIEGNMFTVPYHADFKSTASDNGIFMEESFSDPNLGTFTGSNLIGFDPNDSKIHWYTVDNMGTTHEHIGDWQTPDHFHMEHNSTREGRPYIEKVDVVFEGDNELTLKLVATVDGNEVERVDATFHRTSSPTGSHRM